MADQAQAINWDEVVSYVQETGDKNIWGKLSKPEREQYLQALSKWQGKSGIDVANRPDSAVLGLKLGKQSIPLVTPEDLLMGTGVIRGIKGAMSKHAPAPSAVKAGLGRVSQEGGGIVKGSGLPATITSKAAGHADDVPSNLQKLGRSEFGEAEKRANMFGGAQPEGLPVKPNARGPMNFPEDDGLSEADRLVQEIMKGKTGGSLPNNAPRGTRLKSPKGKK